MICPEQSLALHLTRSCRLMAGQQPRISFVPDPAALTAGRPGAWLWLDRVTGAALHLRNLNLARLLATERSSMTTERPNTLAGLVEKPAEIAGEISHTRARLRQLIIDLDHIDAAIRLFDLYYDVEGIRQKIPTAELSPNFGDGVKDQAAAWA
jgi:hypothetical protein